MVVILLVLLSLRRHRKRRDTEYKPNLDLSSGYDIEPSNAPPDALVSFQNFSASAQPLSFPPAPTDPSSGSRYGYVQLINLPNEKPNSNYTSSRTSMSFENENPVSGTSRVGDAGELIGVPSKNVLSYQSEFPASTTSPLPKDSAPHHGVRLEDSGVRFPAQESLLPAELPPLYTPL